MSLDNFVIGFEISIAVLSAAAALTAFLSPQVATSTLRWRERFNGVQTILILIGTVLVILFAAGTWYWVYLGLGSAVDVAKAAALAGIALLIFTTVLVVIQIDTIRSFVSASTKSEARSNESREKLWAETERLRKLVEERLPAPYEPEPDDDW